LLRRASGTARPFVRWRIFLWRIPIFTGEFYLQAAEGIPFTAPEIISGAAFFVGRGAGRIAGKTGLRPDFRRCSPPAKSSAEKSRCSAVCSPLSAECEGVR